MAKRSVTKKSKSGDAGQSSEKTDDVSSEEFSPVDSFDEESATEEESSVYDSADEEEIQGDEDEDDDDDEEDDDDDEDDFEDQGSSDDDDDLLEKQKEEDDGDDSDIEVSDGVGIQEAYERKRRSWKTSSASQSQKASAMWMHTDDLSSDDEDVDGTVNRIGRVPLHWYDEYDHVGYDAHGTKVVKSASASGNTDRLDQAIANSDNQQSGRFVVHDALNDKNVELTKRQLELIRRVQGGAFAHPEFDAHPDYIDYFSGVNHEISGLNSNRTEPKSRFQPSRFEKLQVDQLLEKLEKGHINMDYLTGKVRDMNDLKRKDPNKPYMMWQGDEEDLLNMRKGPQHIAAPKVPPPGHAESYVPPDEYLPTEDDIKQWNEMELKDRPHGRLVPKKYPNLRSLGSYPHSVTETFERCLDLYLCPRVMKRRLNIDPETLVPQLPKASDLRPFPTAKCIEYKTPYPEGEEPPIIRCVSASPDGQFMVSGASDGYVRLWEVQTGRLLKSWNVSDYVMAMEKGTKEEKHEEETKEEVNNEMNSTNLVKPVVCIEWNPNESHHCLLAVTGKFTVVIATGTAGAQDAEITDALLWSAAKGGGNVTNEKAAKSVKWMISKKSGDKKVEKKKKEQAISSFDKNSGIICALQMEREVASVRWQCKGDYFVTVAPKAGSSAVLIHQLSKGNSQKPFGKAKGEIQLACFHPNKPFLFVASQQHVRIYHLVKQSLVKRLISGCRWISSLDVHPTGDHLIVGSLDRRLIWFDLDLSNTPFKTLKYHERGLRSVNFHGRYPLMASSSDDGSVHVFHSMVYSDLMRNPLIVPVKVLRGHEVTKKFGVLTTSFHPTQPWLFTGGADGRIFLYQDI